MDVIRNCKTGIKHLAESGNDQTLCGIHGVDSRIRGFDHFDKKGNYVGWEDVVTGKKIKEVLKYASCGNCQKMAKHQL